MLVQGSVVFVVAVFMVRCVLLCFDTWQCRACRYKFHVWHWRRVRVCPACKFAQVVVRRAT